MIETRLFTLNEIITLTGGTLLSRESSRSLAQTSVKSVAVDSRNVVSGTLFVALSGEHTDGHCFLADARARGARILLVEKGQQWRYYQQHLPGCSAVAVGSTLFALQELAKAWVSRFPSLQKLAVTGSSGKTTTKEMLSSILSQMGPTVKNPGNYNSEIGLPLSVFQIDHTHRYGVFEMGINHAGEMDSMLNVYKPDVGIMTNIGTAHIGMLGSTEAIAREKSKLFHRHLQGGYIHEDNIWRPYIEKKRQLHLNKFGLKSTPGFQRAFSLGLDGWKIVFEGEEIHLGYIGIHNLYDALAAIHTARELGAEASHIKAGLESLSPLAGRSRVINGKITVIEDSYNSNAESAGRILDYVDQLPWNGEKHVVLGSMKELGEQTVRAHSQIGRRVASLNPEGAFFFGREMECAYDYMSKQSYGKNLFFTDDYDELEQQVTSTVREGDLVLLKGSRAMAMERLVQPLSLVS